MGEPVGELSTEMEMRGCFGKGEEIAALHHCNSLALK
jgi:hypothetical protein